MLTMDITKASVNAYHKNISQCVSQKNISHRFYLKVVNIKKKIKEKIKISSKHSSFGSILNHNDIVMLEIRIIRCLVIINISKTKIIWLCKINYFYCLQFKMPKYFLLWYILLLPFKYKYHHDMELLSQRGAKDTIGTLKRISQTKINL